MIMERRRDLLPGWNGPGAARQSRPTQAVSGNGEEFAGDEVGADGAQFSLVQADLRVDSLVGELVECLEAFDQSAVTRP